MHDNDLPDRGWGSFAAPAQFIVLPLPDRNAWRVERKTASSEVLVHRKSESELKIAGWTQDVVSSRDRCERDGRAEHLSLPSLSSENVLEERVLDAPRGYDTAVRATVERQRGDRIEATALAVGANVRRCIAIVFTTHATGPDAEKTIAERLRLMVAAFSKMRAWNVEDRVGAVEPFR